MDVLKCKMCGGSLNVNKGSTIAECEYCGTKQTLPKTTDDKRLALCGRANSLRMQNEFDKSAELYEQILAQDSSDPEIYWDLVLCKYGIEYVEDPATGKRVPTVHRAQYTSVYVDDNYKKAVEYADDEQKEIYEAEAAKIDEIQQGILEISSKEDPFDVFICYKETDESGERTEDSVIATDLYHRLTKEGFKVFFSRITLQDKLGSAYEPYIFAALNSAKVMVVLGSKPEYFNAVWVKNEWSRYLKLVNKPGSDKVLIPAYKNMNPYNLPKEFSYLQAQDMSKIGFLQDLIDGIKKIIKPSSSNTESKATESKPSSGLSKSKIILISVIAGVLIIAGVLLGIFIPKLSKKNSETDISSASTDNNIVEPTDVDWENLSDMLLYYIPGDYDSENTTPEKTMECLYNGMDFPLYDFIFGEVESIDGTKVKDPDGRFTQEYECWYSKIPVENYNWLVENVLNTKAETVPELIIDDQCVAYEKDGFYYVFSVLLGDEFFVHLTDVTKKPLASNIFEISGLIKEGEVEEYYTDIGMLTATVAVKEMDGKHFWSVYKLNKKYDNDNSMDDAEADDSADTDTNYQNDYNADESANQTEQETQNSSDVIYVYDGTHIPDFGYYYNVEPRGEVFNGEIEYAYEYGVDLDSSEDISLNKYFDLLKQLGYTQQTSNNSEYEYMFTSNYGKVYIRQYIFSWGFSIDIYSPDQF